MISQRNVWLSAALSFALILGLWAVATLPGEASSLWVNGQSMFADAKARGVGDLVTLIIVERAEARQQASTSTGKEAEVSLRPGLGLLSVIPGMSAGGGDEMSASGSTARGGTLEAKMTTRVVEIFPNGNLRIEGRQRIVINGEDQEIVVSGVVRPRDISPDNTVLSTYVADAEIVFNGTGVVGDKQTPGLLTRLLDWLF